MESKKKTCQHTQLKREYLGGMGTGDYECVDCGQVGYGRDWPEKRRAANAEKQDRGE